MFAHKCICLNNRLIAIFDAESEMVQIEKLLDSEISINITDLGLVIQLKHLNILINEQIIEHLLNNPNIFIYAGNFGKYILDPICAVEISRNNLLEARGAYSFFKRGVGV